jgi:hypothetical protein
VCERRKIVETNEALLLVNTQFAQHANVLEFDALLLIKIPANSMQLHYTQSTSMATIKGETVSLAAEILPTRKCGR